ncbi:hypothetical protein XO10_07040 [Marinitoga sp. 1135]|uniref:hypothetical protein n=1 Tax=Marinitoga sp. 1135 TaxID=1643333 RepID=UPI001586ACA4|nr:hypothetical protein [Marinitoga sp. 1135]NUU96029.1 hypothetical protein [Marinitoga sp. 1135]
MDKNENLKEISLLIEELEKIESLIDRMIKNEDYETMPKILEQRKKILEKMLPFADNEKIKEKALFILEKDKERINHIKPEMEKIKKLLKTTNKGKIAIKNGYMKVNEEISRRKFNSNG